MQFSTYPFIVPWISNRPDKKVHLYVSNCFRAPTLAPPTIRRAMHPRRTPKMATRISPSANQSNATFAIVNSKMFLHWTATWDCTAVISKRYDFFESTSNLHTIIKRTIPLCVRRGGGGWKASIRSGSREKCLLYNCYYMARQKTRRIFPPCYHTNEVRSWKNDVKISSYTRLMIQFRETIVRMKLRG